MGKARSANQDYRAAQRHLSRRDPVLKRLISAVGPCTLQIQPDAFLVLVRAIISQMISTKAVASVFARLEQTAGPLGVNVETLYALGEESIRTAGLSGAKARALFELADQVRSGALPLDHFPTLDDDEVRTRLVALRGIGVWTAEMFLIFCLGRTDVLPVGDLGLRAGVQAQYGLDELPGRSVLERLAEPWRPWRSIATWYMWRSRGGVPQSS
jgi:DNA-3-methyladenine glycosylase II